VRLQAQPTWLVYAFVKQGTRLCRGSAGALQGLCCCFRLLRGPTLSLLNVSACPAAGQACTEWLPQKHTVLL
jgi:hypothetical protein